MPIINAVMPHRVTAPDDVPHDDVLEFTHGATLTLRWLIDTANAISKSTLLGSVGAEDTHKPASSLSLNLDSLPYPLHESANADNVKHEFNILRNRVTKIRDAVSWCLTGGDYRAVERLRNEHRAMLRELVSKLSKFDVPWKEELALSADMKTGPVARQRVFHADVMFAPSKTNIPEQTLAQFGFLSRFLSYDHAKYLLASDQKIMAVNTDHLATIGEQGLHATLDAAGYFLLARPMSKKCFPRSRLFWLFPRDHSAAFVEGVGVELWEFATE